MSWELLLQLIVGAPFSGTLYGVVAMCFTLIYKASQVVNFAQGEFLLIGAWVCWWLLADLRLPFWAAFPMTLAFLMAFGILLQVVLVRPMISEPTISVIMVTIGLSIFFEAVMNGGRSMSKGAVAVFAAILAASASAAVAADPLVGNLVDYTGRTAQVGTPYGQAKVDAAKWVNAHGGVDGKQINLQTFDYSYEVPRAIATYKQWKQDGMVALQGWGTADTEALVGFIADDQIPDFSASYSAHLTDPMGKGLETKKAAPYNFIMGPSYSDSIRAMLQWAKVDWEKKRSKGAPKFVHMGDNHPYPNAPKRAGEEYAKEIGFEVLPAIQYSLIQGAVSELEAVGSQLRVPRQTVPIPTSRC